MEEDQIESISYIQIGENQHPIDAVTVGGQTLPSSDNFLPAASSSNNGKILRVVDGQWVMVDPMFIYAGTGIPGDLHGNNGDLYFQIDNADSDEEGGE